MNNSAMTASRNMTELDATFFFRLNILFFFKSKCKSRKCLFSLKCVFCHILLNIYAKYHCCMFIHVTLTITWMSWYPFFRYTGTCIFGLFFHVLRSVQYYWLVPTTNFYFLPWGYFVGFISVKKIMILWEILRKLHHFECQKVLWNIWSWDWRNWK